MKSIIHSKCILLILLLFSFLMMTPGIISAATTIDNMAFDIGVVNDNNGVARPIDYSYSNSSNTVNITGIQPETNAEVSYFLNHASQNDESQLIATIDISQLTETSSEAGIMFFNGEFVSAVGTQSWCRLAITGDRKIFFEEKTSCGVPEKRELYTLGSTTQNQIRIKADVKSGFVYFSISQPTTPSQPLTTTDNDWLPLGSSSTLYFSHSFGLFLQPASNTIQQQVQFSAISITRSNPNDNGLGDLAGYNTTGIPGLGAWPISSPLPSNFFSHPMKFIEDIKSQYSSGFDNYQNNLFNKMKSLLSQPIEQISGDELNCIEISERNAQKYLADIINSYITGESRKFPPNTTQYQLYFGFSLSN